MGAGLLRGPSCREGFGLSVDEWGRKDVVNVPMELASESVRIMVKLRVATVSSSTF